MYKILRIFYLPVLLLLFFVSSCVRNDGDIGNLFGNWFFSEIICDGEQVKPDHEIMINFQGNLFSIGEVSDEPVFLPELVGKWSEDNKEFVLDAGYNAGSLKEFPASLGFEGEKVVKLQVISQSHNYMSWQWISPSGHEYIYKLKKIL